MKQTHKIITVLCLLIALGALLLSGCAPSDLQDGYIMEGVTVAGVKIGGLTKEDALAAVRAATADTYTKTPMTVEILDETIILSPELTGIRLDAEAAVEAAYTLGRDISKAEYQALKVQAMTTGIHTDISSCLTLKEADLRAILGKLCKAYTDSVLVHSSYEIIGEAPDLAAEELPEQLQTLVVTIGTPAFHLDMDVLCQQVMDAYRNNEFSVEYRCDVSEPEAVDLDKVYEEIFSEPVEPVMDTKTFEVSDHAYGYGFDLEAAKELVAQAVYGESVEIPLVATAPEQTKEALASLLFRDVLAKASAYSASSSNRATNLRLACEALDGIVLLPGEKLSYNNALGERTPERGWKPAGTYVGGETVDTYGGGICQPSSVLYYCALLADLEIVHRACHQYISSYVEPGMDATVYWGGVDFIFANNTEYPIRIQAKANGGKVEIALIGTDTKDYYIDMEYYILDSWSWEDVTLEVPEDNNPKGYKDGEVITTPYTGYKVTTYKCRYSKETNKLIERVFEAESIYDSRDQVTVKILYNEPETEPTEPLEPSEPTDPEPTDPTPTEPSNPDPSEPDSSEPDPSEPDSDYEGQPGQGVEEA